MSAPDDVKRKVACKKSIMWTSFSAPPTSLTLLSPPPLLSLFLTVNLRARYIKHPSTLTFMYKHLCSHHSASKPCIRKEKKEKQHTPEVTWTVLPADVRLSWMSLRRFISTLSPQDHLCHTLFLLKFGSWYWLSQEEIFIYFFLFLFFLWLRRSRAVWHEGRRSTKRHEDHMSVGYRCAAVSHLSGELNVILIWPFLFLCLLPSLWFLWMMFALIW